MDLSISKRSGKRNAEDPIDAASTSAKKKKVNPPPVEFNIEMFSAPSGANYQIVKRWNLEDGNSLTVTYQTGQVVVAIGNLLSFNFFPPTSQNIPFKAQNLMKVGGSEIEALLDKWDEINDAIGKKATFRVSIPVISKYHNLVFKLTNYRGEYGMVIYTTPIIHGDDDHDKLSSIHVFLNEMSLQKITRAKHFIKQHLEYLQINLEPYTIMQAEIMNFVEKMRIVKRIHSHELESADIASCIETITSMDLKKTIIDSYKEELKNRELECGINIYSLYAFCIGQRSIITSNVRSKKYTLERIEEEEYEVYSMFA